MNMNMILDFGFWILERTRAGAALWPGLGMQFPIQNPKSKIQNSLAYTQT